MQVVGLGNGERGAERAKRSAILGASREDSGEADAEKETTYVLELIEVMTPPVRTGVDLSVKPTRGEKKGKSASHLVSMIGESRRTDLVDFTHIQGRCKYWTWRRCRRCRWSCRG